MKLFTVFAATVAILVIASTACVDAYPAKRSHNTSATKSKNTTVPAAPAKHITTPPITHISDNEDDSYERKIGDPTRAMYRW